MTKVSVVIPTLNYANRKEVFRLVKEQTVNTELIVVSHVMGGAGIGVALTEEELKYIDKVIKYDGPFWYPHEVNLGAKEASNDILVIMNDDAFLVDKNLLSKMVSYLEKDSHIGLMGVPSINGTFMKNEDDYGTTLIAHYDKDADVTQGVSGHFEMFSKQAFHAIGGHDEGFRMICSDVRTALECHRHGFLVLTYKTRGVVHSELSTRGVIFSSRIKEYLEQDRADNVRFRELYTNVGFVTRFDGKEYSWRLF